MIKAREASGLKGRGRIRPEDPEVLNSIHLKGSSPV